MKWVRLTICLTAALTLNGCWFGRKAKTAPAPAPVQVPRAAGTNRSPAPNRKTPAKRKTSVSAPRAAQPAAIPPKAAETKKPTLPPEPQHLGRILSAEEIAQYRTDYERSSAAAREMLRTLVSGHLPPDTSDSLGRIRSFLAQAQEAVSFDPPKAAQLAYRAEVLARDLVRLLE
jgi:hypothetical protein